MNRLIKDGRVILDGTEPLYKKEKVAFEKLEYIEDLMEEFKIEKVEDFRKIVELYRDIYKYCKEGNWITICNDNFVYCEVNKDLGSKEFKWKRKKIW